MVAENCERYIKQNTAMLVFTVSPSKAYRLNEFSDMRGLSDISYNVALMYNNTKILFREGEADLDAVVEKAIDICLGDFEAIQYFSPNELNEDAHKIALNRRWGRDA